MSANKFGKVTNNHVLRGCDSFGCGYFGAARGSHKHQGVDIVVVGGQSILSPISGKMTKVSKPYADDSTYKGVQIENSEYLVKIFYCLPSVSVGAVVTKGMVVAHAQEISNKYGSSMTDHVHLEVRSKKTGQLINPEKLW